MGRKATVTFIGKAPLPLPFCKVNTDVLQPGEKYTILGHRVECGFSLWELEGVGWVPTIWCDKPVFSPQY